MRTGLDVEWVRHGARVVVTAVGDVDAATAPRLQDAITAARAGTGLAAVVVDLTAVGFLDSSGLAVLAEAEQHCAAAGQRLQVRADNRAVLVPLRITGLDQLLSLEAAGR